MGEIGAAELTGVLTDVRESAARYPVVQSLLRLRAQGVRIDAQTTAAIARAFERRVSEVERVESWLQSLTEKATAETVLHRCVSISCTANGASALWDEISGLLDEAGIELKVVPVHCLSQCEHGPSLGQGDGIYTGRNEQILTDDRPWRESPFNQEE